MVVAGGRTGPPEGNNRQPSQTTEQGKLKRTQEREMRSEEVFAADD